MILQGKVVCLIIGHTPTDIILVPLPTSIMRRPQIWLAPTLASAITGPLATKVFAMSNTSYGAGMGTSGLVGQLGTFETMGYSWDVLLKVLLICFILPAIFTLIFHRIFLKLGWVRPGDMKLKTLD